MPPSMRLSTKLDAAPTSPPLSRRSSYGAGPGDCERFDGAPGRPPPRDGWRVCSRGAATEPRRAAASSEVGSSSSSSLSGVAVAQFFLFFPSGLQGGHERASSSSPLQRTPKGAMGHAPKQHGGSTPNHPRAPPRPPACRNDRLPPCACRVVRHCCAVCHCIVCHCLLRRLPRTLFRRRALTCFHRRSGHWCIPGRCQATEHRAQAGHRRCCTTTLQLYRARGSSNSSKSKSGGV